MTALKKFFEIVQSNEHLKAIFEQMGGSLDDYDFGQSGSGKYDESDFKACVENAYNIIHHGIAGGYPGFVWYSETEQFYNDNSELILDYLEDHFTLDEFLEIAKNKLDLVDIVDRTQYAMNFYVWLYAECVLNDFYEEIEKAFGEIR